MKDRRKKRSDANTKKTTYQLLGEGKIDGSDSKAKKKKKKKT
jgi:hypothetical protein